MKKIILIITSLFIVACEEKVSTDTAELSKKFMKALMSLDEKTIEKIKHPKDGGRINIKNSLESKQKRLKEQGVRLDELKYTVQKGKTDDIECVVVQSNGTRKGNGILPLLNWRLKFSKSKYKEGLLLKDIDANYGHFRDKGCKK